MRAMTKFAALWLVLFLAASLTATVVNPSSSPAGRALRDSQEDILPDGSLVMIGSFPDGYDFGAAASIDDLFSAFSLFGETATSSVFGQGGKITGTVTFEDTDQEFTGKLIYFIVFDQPSAAAASELIVFTADEDDDYVFPMHTGIGTDTTSPSINSAQVNAPIGSVTADFLTLVALETPVYTVTAAVNPEGSGTVEGIGSYQEGSVIQLTAASSTGWCFVEWNGDVPPGQETVNPVTITVDAGKAVIAHFEAILYTLTVEAVNGTVTVDPDQAEYNEGTQVTLTAVPNPGQRFVNWSGDLAGSNNPVVITMDSDRVITANFEAVTCTLTVNAENGSVTIDPGQAEYDCGGTVTLTASPADGHIFAGWTGSVVSADNPLILTMDSDKSVIANFITEAEAYFENPVFEGQGWWNIEWFGRLYLAEFPWCYHEGHAWLYAAGEGAGDHWFWFWEGGLEWMWTSPEAYPLLWSPVREWLYYWPDSPLPDRYFYAFATEEWLFL